MGGLRAFLAGLTLVWAMVGGGRAEASAIYTYQFEQTDYVYSLGGDGYPTTVRGSFTGTADPSGHINIATLSALDVAFDVMPDSTPGLFYSRFTGIPDYFSFQIGDTSGSTLAFKAPLTLSSPLGSEICVGAAVAFLCNGGTSRGAVVLGSGAPIVFARSDIAPVVSLVSVVSTPAVATTPIPGALLLFGTALGGLGAMGMRRRKLVQA